MERLVDWRALALLLVSAASFPVVSPSTDSVTGTWMARQVRWRAPRPLTRQEQADPRRRPSETMLVDLQLEIRQDGDSLLGLLTNAQDPDDAQWRRLLGGRQIGDSLFLAAAAGPGMPNIAFEGEVAAARLRGRLNVPPRAEHRVGVLPARSGAAGRQALPPLPVRDEWLPVAFSRAPK